MENPSAVMPVTLAHGPLDLDSGIPGYRVTGEDGLKQASTDSHGFKSVIALKRFGRCWQNSRAALAGQVTCRASKAAWSQQSQF